MKSKDWTTWALLGVIAVSICVAIPPLNELEVYPGCGRMCQYRIGLGGLAGVIGGCLALLVWRIRKDRGTQVRDVVSWVSLIVIVALAGWATFWWTPGATGDIYWWFLGLPPFTVVLFVYLVLLGHLIQRALGRRILGLPVAVLLVGLVVELLLFEILAGFDWPVLLSMALGILMSVGCIVGMNRLVRFGPKPDRRNALVFILIVSLMGLVGVALSRPTTGLQVKIQYRVGVRDFHGAYLYGVDLSGTELRRADLTGAMLWYANLNEADLRRANLSGADLSGADLFMADLSSSDLRNVDLTGANLQEANLSGANLEAADLTGAKLVGADLSGANLRDAVVTDEQLAAASSLKGATMPDGTVHE